MKRRQILRAAYGMAAYGVLPAAIASTQTKTNGNIVLGQSAALTGPAGELGVQFRDGALCHFESINARGGIGGRKIELRTLDDGYDPERCAANTRRLIDEGVFALFGYVGTATSMAALRYANESQKLFFAPFSGSEALRIPFSPYVFHIRASYVDETTAIVNHLTTVGIKRIAVFYQNDSEGKAGLLGVGRALKLRYLSPTGIGKVERNSDDVEAAVRSILASKPDAIVQIAAYHSCAAFIRAARKAGYQGMFCDISSVGTQSLIRELPEASRGVMVSQVMPYPFAATTPIAKEYLATGKAVLKEKFEPSYSSIEGYVAARTIVEAMRKAPENLSQAGVIAALESLADFDLGGFNVSFGPKRHSASRMVDLTLLTSDGKIRH
ncbi:ABC transporter substrate-binding protein [Herbaspirillum sp. ST 5-3]|uniref:ABC transporter substrate-binding protein n=1 Tax=Oxalobacteraceae TaxID=75682 RepID=UPI0010A41660|nr:ABC transporter substrate-binding protein [Herbaspirillum sp. ST 5-3]